MPQSKRSCPLLEESINPHKRNATTTELQERADHADQSVLFFLASANFWEKHAIMSMAHITYAIAH